MLDFGKSFLILTISLVIIFFLNISLGSVSIPLSAIIEGLFGSSSNSSWDYIISNYRLPKALTAVIAGSGLGVAGLLMQTLFRNPLAGPFVLGISSGASLGVALLILGGSAIGGSIAANLTGSWALVVAASIGSFFVLLAVMIVSARIRDTMAILIIGLMFGSITAAVVSVLAYFSPAEQLQQYIFWGFGSLGNLSWAALGVLALSDLIGMILAVYSIKSLNSFLLGENYAKSLGVNIKMSRLIIIFSTSLLAGGITAFTGPIAFVGLAVPHLTRQIFRTSNHLTLLPAVFIVGALIMLVCDSISQLPTSEYVLPINAITSILGAPVVIWLLLRKKRMVF